jgi:hypothetical protein
MTDTELMLLQHAANGGLLFHIGTWGGPAGYRWCGPDGLEAGRVPPAHDDTLERLNDRGLIAITPRTGPLDRRVVATPTGLATLFGLAHAA